MGSFCSCPSNRLSSTFPVAECLFKVKDKNSNYRFMEIVLKAVVFWDYQLFQPFLDQEIQNFIDFENCPLNEVDISHL